MKKKESDKKVGITIMLTPEEKRQLNKVIALKILETGDEITMAAFVRGLIREKIKELSKKK